MTDSETLPTGQRLGAVLLRSIAGSSIAVVAAVAVAGIQTALKSTMPSLYFRTPYILLIGLIAYFFGRGPGIVALVASLVVYTASSTRLLGYQAAPSLGGGNELEYIVFVVVCIGSLIGMTSLHYAHQRLTSRAEIALRESEERLRLATEAAKTGTWLWDLQTQALTCDSRCCYALGVPAGSEMSRELFLSVVHPDDRQRVADAIDRSIDDRVDYDAEFRVIWPDASAHWLHSRGQVSYDESGTALRMMETVTEVTDRKRAQQLNEGLSTINMAMRSTLDFDSLMEKVVEESVNSLGVESGVITLREDDQWVVRYKHGFPQLAEGARFADEDIPRECLAAWRRMPTSVNDTEAGDIECAVQVEHGVRAYVAIPLIIGDETIGILWLNNHSGPFSFGEAEMDFAAKLAGSVSLALWNVHLFNEERDARSREEALRVKLERQHNDMQRALLPGRIPTVEGCAIAARFVPGTAGEQIGGDFYDVFETEDGEIGILIGDVSGKGVEAAALAAVTRSTVRAFAYELSSPGLALSHANSVIYRQGFEPERFATVVLAVFDPATGRLDYASAGHPPAMILRTNGEVELLAVGNKPIRLEETADYATLSCELASGDRLVMYTDGISEARNQERMYDVDGIQETLRDQSGKKPEEILDALFRVAGDISMGSLSDDAAVIVVERL